MTTAAPSEIRVKRAERVVEISYPDGVTHVLSAELLRVESPSAETQGHGGARPPPPSGKRQVTVIDARPVGAYAVRFVYDDGHDTGLYTWTLLRELGDAQDERMTDYLDRLAAAGGRREA